MFISNLIHYTQSLSWIFWERVWKSLLQNKLPLKTFFNLGLLLLFLGIYIFDLARLVVTVLFCYFFITPAIVLLILFILSKYQLLVSMIPSNVSSFFILLIAALIFIISLLLLAWGLTCFFYSSFSSENWVCRF